jgi:DNA-binding response OmpR family regulator
MSDEGPCILVVEDDDAAARLVALSLRPTRARVVVHPRAFGVLEAIAAERPAAVVMDVMMPGLDGPSLVELVRQDPELAQTRVVLWSALDRAELERRASGCGADAVVEKVAGPRVLVDRLEAWLRAWDGVELR